MKTIFIFLFCFLLGQLAEANVGVRLKDLARIEGNREIALVGYGIVIGLSGSGDSSRNRATLQSLANTLSNFGLKVSERDLNSRNVAAVMVTSELPPFGEPGDRIDIAVSSIGDAKSLVGGTLLMTPLYGPDQKLYAIGQGSVIVGGYRVESFSNLTKKNHTTVGNIARGATIERAMPREDIKLGEVNILLNEPDYTTAQRVVRSISSTFLTEKVEAVHPGKIAVVIPKGESAMSFIARLEGVFVVPDIDARVVVNERTGTIVAGSNVKIGAVSIAHGDLRIEIETTFNASQPGLTFRPGSGVQTVVTPETKISVVENGSEPVIVQSGTTVGELVQSLNKIRLSTRDIISILQSIKSAGALHADLIIQ